MSKRKAHSLNKRLHAQTVAAVSGYALAMQLSKHDKKVVMSRLSDAKVVPVSQRLALAVSDCAFKWAVLLVVWSTEQNGKARTVTHYERMAAAYKHTALIEHLNSIHQFMIADEKARGNEVFDAGWIAVPVPKLDDDELIIKMMGVIENV